MRSFIFLVVVLVGVLALPPGLSDLKAKEDPHTNIDLDFNEAKALALPCNITDCQLPDCLCSSTDIPGGLQPNVTPQLVILTFDDAVQNNNYPYYIEALSGRTNPNNCSISATFYVTHEFTNYSMLHELHAQGHEIALHSITHFPSAEYWKDISYERLVEEFVGQRTMIGKFASIPTTDIKGIRMPFLQAAGNNQIKMMNDNNFTYDHTRISRSMEPGMWPYTFKYASTQDCLIGPCATDSYPNVWAIPMTQWENDVGNSSCSMADSCVNYNNTSGSTLKWMKKEFLKQYEGNRSPFGVYLHASWFQVNSQRFVEYKQFLDYLKTLNDVYVVSASQVIDWVRVPKTIAEMKTQPCHRTYAPTCKPIICRLLNVDGNERYIVICAEKCPAKYPWIGNPLGE